MAANSETTGALPPIDDGIDGNFLEEGIEEEKVVVSKKLLQLAQRKKEGQDAIEQALREKDLEKRARALVAIDGAVKYPDLTKTAKGSPKITNTAMNRITLLDAVYQSGTRPHRDTFSGKIVDHTGTPVDDHYSMTPLIRLMSAGGIVGVEETQIGRTFTNWAKIPEFESNSLIEYFNKRIPKKWDQRSRVETKLIELFDCDCKDEGPDGDIERQLNRDFGRYFWMALYMRIVEPGTDVPVSLALFGGLNAGKSYFSKRICELALGRKSADAVQLDLSSDPLEFLRKITGHSVVANVGEMVGFDRAKANWVRTFMTKGSDMMRQLYEGNREQPRQWITILDGNNYDGLLKDVENGERRLYPQFANQRPMKDGKRDYEGKGEKKPVVKSADLGKSFENDFWQIMAECRAWLKVKGNSYHTIKNDMTQRVGEFCKKEIEHGRGTSRSIELDRSFAAIIRTKGVVTRYRLNKDESTGRPTSYGYAISSNAFLKAYSSLYRGQHNEMHADIAMSREGGSKRTLKNRQEGWFFPDYDDSDRVKFGCENPLNKFGISHVISTENGVKTVEMVIDQEDDPTDEEGF